MRRAIVVTIVVAILAVAALVAVLISDGGQATGPRRPAPETRREAPGPPSGGFAPGAEARPENATHTRTVPMTV